MGWHELAFAFTDIPQLFARNDDDLYDRLSHRWTAAQLIGFALLTTTTLYVGEPIHCWMPAYFEDSWEDYTNSYCWIRNTYRLPMEEQIPQDIPQRQRREIVYYQWVPLILMAQALLFYFPIVVWRTMNDRTGVDMNDVIETAEKVQQAKDLDAKLKRLYLLTQQTHRYVGVTKTIPQQKCTPRWLLRHCFCICCGKHAGNYVTTLYVIIKIIFLVNVFGQMWLLNALLGHNFANYGFHVLDSMINGNDWIMSDRFPRVTMCDLLVRRLGNNHRYSVQCVLTINFFNEKIYLYIWFWFVFVTILTLIGFVLLLLRVLIPSDRLKYIRNHLLLGGMLRKDSSDREEKMVENFVYKYLQQDGCLLLRLVGHNTNKVTVTELICSLWENYHTLPHIKKGLLGMESPDGSELDLTDKTT